MNIRDALSVVYGSPPYGWNTYERFSHIQEVLRQLPKVNGREVPLTTYLLFAKASLRMDLIIRFDVVFSENLQSQFASHMRQLEDQSKVQVTLDDGNFKAEVTAFASLEMAIKEPHLDVSPLYRYMVAIQQGMLTCIEDSLVSEAISALRVNPYLYFAYGPDFEVLMPVTWEDL